MPVYGLGTWEMGGKKVYNPENDDEKDITAIKHAIELGVTHIDTAENYAEGYAEKLVGRAIKGYDRSKLFLVTKVARSHLGYSDLMAAAKQSLERLQTNYLDLYLIHSPNPEISVEESMKAMDELKSQGVIRNIGVSNFTIENLKAAQSASKNNIVANQIHYNLQIREVEKNVLGMYCQENDVMLIAWRPLQKGMLLTEGQEVLEKMSKKYDKTPSQIALNWLLSQDNVVTLSKTRSVEHLKENLGALEWKMDNEDIEFLRNNFPGQLDISDTVPLS